MNSNYEELEVIIEGTPAMFAAMVETFAIRLWQSGQLEQQGYLIGKGPVFFSNNDREKSPETPQVSFRVFPPKYKDDHTGEIPEGSGARLGWITATAIPNNRTQLLFTYPPGERRLLVPWSLLLEEMRRLGYLAASEPLLSIDEPPAISPAPPYPSKGPKFRLELAVPTTASILVTWLQQQYGNRRSGFFAHEDGAPLDNSDSEELWGRCELEPITLREDIGAGARLYTVLETYGPGSDTPDKAAVIGYNVRELEPGSAPRLKLTIQCWPLRSQVFDYLAGVLAGLFQDYPTAGASLVHYVHYSPEGELPAWLLKPHSDFFQWLEWRGSRQGDYLADHVWRYAIEVEEAKRAARDDLPVIPGDAGANEPAREYLPAPKYPYSLNARDEAKLRQLWADNSLSYEDLATEFKVTPDRIKDYKRMYGLPDRKRGRKSLK